MRLSRSFCVVSAFTYCLKMLRLISLFAFVTVAIAAVARYPAEEKPAEHANESGCWISELNSTLPYDQPYYQEGRCQRWLCQSSNNETIAESCGALYIRDGCRKVSDLTKQYPGCCGEEVCDASTPAPTSQEPTTDAVTTGAPATQAMTNKAPITQAPATETPTQALSNNQGCVAYASAESHGDGKPSTVEYTSGPNAQAKATAS